MQLVPFDECLLAALVGTLEGLGCLVGDHVSFEMLVGVESLLAVGEIALVLVLFFSRVGSRMDGEMGLTHVALITTRKPAFEGPLACVLTLMFSQSARSVESFLADQALVV